MWNLFTFTFFTKKFQNKEGFMFGILCLKLKEIISHSRSKQNRSGINITPKINSIKTIEKVELFDMESIQI